MLNSRLRPISRWLIGFFVGTAIIAVTSPLFVRSYVPLVPDPVRGTWTLQPGQSYRWRSEGYATTEIGPHGMPGQTKAPGGTDENSIRIALWGDSQAEGVCVGDEQKLFRQIERAFADSNTPVQVTVFPFARSGEDASIWLPQVPAVERAFEIDLHVILIVEWQDLAITNAADQLDADLAAGGNRVGLAATLPAFVIQAARNLLREDDGTTPRKLRWSVGPRTKAIVTPATKPAPVDWTEPMRRVQDAATAPVLIVHAPRLPEIVAGHVMTTPGRPDVIASMQSVAAEWDITVLDLTDALMASARRGHWPHGFQNGQIGVGHLNEVGYRIISLEIADCLSQGACSRLLAADPPPSGVMRLIPPGN